MSENERTIWLSEESWADRNRSIEADTVVLSHLFAFREQHIGSYQSFALLGHSSSASHTAI